MAIYLIRHGETRGNAERIVQTADTPLSPRGREQARRLAARLADQGIGGILASDLTRAAETAEALRAGLGVGLELEPLLQERNLGIHRGTPYAELRVELFAEGYAPPEGESWEVFHARVARAWERVLAAAGATPGHLAVVTHGLVCLSLAGRILALPPGPIFERSFANASLTIVETEPPHALQLLDCVEHLRPGPRRPRG